MLTFSQEIKVRNNSTMLLDTLAGPLKQEQSFIYYRDMAQQEGLHRMAEKRNSVCCLIGAVLCLLRQM